VRRALSATLAPAFANLRAVANPMPPLAPVTRATFPSMFPFISAMPLSGLRSTLLSWSGI
jgi:hypothetical protein